MKNAAERKFAAAALDRPGTFFIDDRPPGSSRGVCHLLTDPLEVITAEAPHEVPQALTRLDNCLASGLCVAGYISYEAGLGLDASIRSRHPAPAPLVWLGVYSRCGTFPAQPIDLGPPDSPSAIVNERLNMDRPAYLAAVSRAQDYIAAGDVYQINYTGKLRFEHRGSPRRLFARLRRCHPVCHSAWINTGRQQIISLSPELFLRRDGLRLTTRPMKGTMHRGRWSEEDQALGQLLAADPKNVAENVMIVDLMRNDLGRVCRPGGVRVAKVLEIERYRSLMQMTSTVEGSLRGGISAAEILRATFSPGSVTGVPKVRALEIIDELEPEARGVYCGTVGLFRPDGCFLLSVAIRTVVCQDGACELGVGSGIVADSEPEAEWAEMQLKGTFLAAEAAEFQLLETVRRPEGRPPTFRRQHLQRMRRSASYFGWDFPEGRLEKALDRASAQAMGDVRLRWLLAEDGRCRVEAAPLGPAVVGPLKLLLASRPIDPGNIFLYHKTTQRQAYDADRRQARREGCFDVLYRNLEGQITETTIANLIALIDGRWYTPPLRCGLLPGIWRAGKLARSGVAEREISLDDLLRATRIVVGNSVRGDLEVDQIMEPAGVRAVWRRAARHADVFPAARAAHRSSKRKTS